MQDIHCLYSEVVYRFNAEFHLIWRTINKAYFNDIEDIPIQAIPMFFSKHSRTFNWISTVNLAGIAKTASGADAFMHLRDMVRGLVDWNKAKDTVSGFDKTLRQCAWDKYLKDLPDAPLYDRAKELVNDVLNAHESADEIKSGWEPKCGWEQLNRAMLALYSGFHHGAESNMEGFLYKFLEACGRKCETKRLNYIFGNVFNPDAKGEPPFLWLNVEGARQPGCQKNLAVCDCTVASYISLTDITCQRRTKPKSQVVTNQSAEEKLAFDIFLEHMLLKDFKKHLGTNLHVAFVPLYDLQIDGQGLGGIQAVFLLFFPDHRIRLKWFQKHYGAFQNSLAKLTTDVSASGETAALDAPIKPPYDLVQHFLKVLPFIQDWETAVIFEGEKPLYRYRREKMQDSAKWGWNGQAVENVGGPKAPEASSFQTCDSGWYMWWTAGKNGTINLWSADLIPGLGEAEIAKFGQMSIRFEFPKACRIPQNPEARKFLCEAYLRQQLNLMRVLIPKVRARRAALRSALSAIMGRNLSHNIGSHVLARYSSAIRGDLVIANPDRPDRPDHRTELLSYLQRRMDFLAEVATSEQAFWSQPLSLKDQINRLNYETQNKLFFGEEKGIDPEAKEKRPVLLSYITGKENLLASVEYGTPERSPSNGSDGYIIDGKQKDLLFSCPGGEVGVHALFVLLENIIRNSARHGADDNSQMVKIFVAIDDPKQHEDFIKLCIIDPRTQLHKDGRIKSSPQTDAAIATKENEWIAKGSEHSCYENGKRQKLDCLNNEINSILKGEPFLDDSGNPNPKYWGVREMQICAHYLGGLPLSDLEMSDAPLLTAGVHPLGGDKYCLKYECIVQRPKLMTVVSKDLPESPPENGVQVIRADADSPNWRDIAHKARGYSFIALEDDIKRPECPSIRASLPVRMVSLSTSKIKTTVTQAGAGSDLKWMEPLHEFAGKEYQNLRENWRENGKNKPLWGVAVCNGEALPKIDLDERPEGNGGGLFFVQKNDNGALSPLSDQLQDWHATLAERAIAAAWIDHPAPNDFDAANAGFGQAAQLYNLCPRLWVCAEGAFSGSVHAEFLKTAKEKGLGAELLAAALPRVAVIDERVQSEWDTPVRYIPLSTVWPNMGVWVPAKNVCDLDKPKLDLCKKFLKKPASRADQFPIDCLVIHLTILETLCKENAHASLTDTLEELIADTQACKAHIIIVTGRGVPAIALARDSDRLSRARYLPISALLESLVARPSKLGLMRALWSAGRPADPADDKQINALGAKK